LIPQVQQNNVGNNNKNKEEKKKFHTEYIYMETEVVLLHEVDL